MKQRQKIVTQTPLKQLWRDGETLAAAPAKDLGTEEIINLLRLGKVQFVVANVGHPLNWIPTAQCYEFWKTEVSLHLVEPNAAKGGFRLEDYLDGYCYTAAQWEGVFEAPIVVLTMYH